MSLAGAGAARLGGLLVGRAYGARRDRNVLFIWIDDLRPQLCYYGHSEIHNPYLPFCASKKYWDLYDRSKLEIPANDQLPNDVSRWPATNWGELRKYDAIPHRGPLSDEQALELIHG